MEIFSTSGLHLEPNKGHSAGTPAIPMKDVKPIARPDLTPSGNKNLTLEQIRQAQDKARNGQGKVRNLPHDKTPQTE